MASSNRKIRFDRHGPYVRTDGYLFRPQETQNSYPIFPLKDMRNDNTTQLKGEVKAKHIGDTPFALVSDPATGKQEYWHSHGDYIGQLGTIVQSDILWRPLVKQTEAEKRRASQRIS